jgi:hypothetical protein
MASARAWPIGIAVAAAAIGCGDAGATPADARPDGDLDAPVDARPDADPAAPAAFRFVDLDLRDPHVYAPFQGCRDITDAPLMQFAWNAAVQARLEGDQDADGALDASLVTVFRPLAQGAATGALELHRPRCSAPVSTTTCHRAGAAGPAVVTTVANLGPGVTCLAALPGTVRPYAPAVTSALPPCHRTDPMTITLDLAGAAVTLRNARIAATYFGDPAQGTNNGLLMGFLTVADARATVLPASMPLVGGQTLESVLPGGNGACTGFSDRDVDGGTPGWWLYFNFLAARVPWIDD